MPHESVVLDTESYCDPYYLGGQERWCKEGVMCTGLWGKRVGSVSSSGAYELCDLRYGS